MAQFFQFLSSLVSIYSFICFLRIILSWIPNLAYSKIGQIIASITDPFFNLFRKLPLRVGVLDFTPMIGFLILSVLNSALSNIARTGRFYVAGFIAQIISYLWEIACSILGFILIIVIIRLISLAVNKNKIVYNSIWSRLDDFLTKISFQFTRIFTAKRTTSYTVSLLIFLAELLIVLLVGFILLPIIINLILRFIPF